MAKSRHGFSASAPGTPPEAMIFGPVEESDIRFMARVERETNPIPWPESMLRDLLQDSGHGFLAGRLDGRLVCYACYQVLGTTARIANFTVHPSYQRHGIGTRFLQAVLDRLRGLGLQQVRLQVAATNVGARALYRNAGFVECRGESPRTDDPAIEMERPL